MASPIGQIELAMLTQLRTVPRAYQGLLVESYGGQLDDETFDWVRVLPACWVTFAQTQEVKRISQHVIRVRGSYEVLCAQYSLSENAGRLNTAAAGADVGVYQLLEDNKCALANQKLGLGIAPFTPGAIRSVMKSMVNRMGVVVYAQEFFTEWTEAFADAAPTPEGELQTIGLAYYLKPQHTPPGDDPDKTDLITTQ